MNLKQPLINLYLIFQNIFNIYLYLIGSIISFKKQVQQKDKFNLIILIIIDNHCNTMELIKLNPLCKRNIYLCLKFVDYLIDIFVSNTS
jgi:hypothetical protein